MLLRDPFGCRIIFIYRVNGLLFYCKWSYLCSSKTSSNINLQCFILYDVFMLIDELRPLFTLVPWVSLQKSCGLFTFSRKLVKRKQSFSFFLACAKPCLLSFNCSTHIRFILLIKDWFNRFRLEVKLNWNGLTLRLVTYLVCWERWCRVSCFLRGID